MCGIAGIVSQKAVPSLFDCIREMTDIIEHRGPDDAGHKFFGEPHPIVALGHRRLSILDLSERGHQPMPTTDQRYWISYNGEVYNAPELRAELETLGYSFQSTTDTEVILNAYAEWGPECLSRFNGMFAFVLYDTQTQRIFAARDRFGIKPLYYWLSPDGFAAFASEIKQFTVLPGWKAIANKDRLYDFLAFEALDHTEETLFEGVYQLRGGEYFEASVAELSEGRAVITRWYDLASTPFEGSFSEAAQQFEELLRDSVRLRLRADVPVGSCLSGGLDSSAVVCLARELLGPGAEQKTFSACSKYQAFDERHYVDIVVEATQVAPHYTYPSPEELFKTCEKIVWYQDEPFPSTSLYAQWKVFELARPEVKVMLDGQGADEQLAGYSNFYGSLFYELFQKFQFKQLLREMRGAKSAGHWPFGYLAQEVLPEGLRQWLRQLLGKTSTQVPWLALEGQATSPFQHIRQTNLNQHSYWQLVQTNLPKLLHWEDRDSMAHSIEARTPFLDYRLVEFALSLPSSYKLSKGESKRVMRRGLRNVLPKEIAQRRDKMGFVTAEEQWVRRDAPNQFRDMIDAAIEGSGGVLNAKLREETEAIISGKKRFNSSVWRAVSFHQWKERFSVKV